LSEEQKMAAMMGIEGFDTTKGKIVQDNHTTAARGYVAKTKRREYRQYMNRKVVRKDGVYGTNVRGGSFGGKGGGKGVGKGGGKGGKGR
jgi:hypothetical protein